SRQPGFITKAINMLALSIVEEHVSEAITRGISCSEPSYISISGRTKGRPSRTETARFLIPLVSGLGIGHQAGVALAQFDGIICTRKLPRASAQPCISCPLKERASSNHIADLHHLQALDMKAKGSLTFDLTLWC